MGNKLALAALVLALLGLVLHAFGGGGERAADAAPAPGAGAELLARIEALEAERAELRQALGAARMQTPPLATEREPASPDPRIEELERRLASLEQGLVSSASEQRELAAEQDQALLRLAVSAYGTTDIDATKRRALDRSLTEAERVGALGTLRGQRLADGTDARLAVLDEMIEIARASTDGKMRADVWRQLSHVTDPRLKQPLLDALAYDEFPKAREEAAETLADFLPDAAVERALRTAMENDTEQSVRRQAGASLAGR